MFFFILHGNGENMKKKELTKQEIKDICNEYDKKGVNLHTLADKYNVRTEYISKILKNNNVILKRHEFLSEEHEKQLCNDYKNGMHIHDVARKYHTDISKVKDILQKYDIYIRKKGDLLKTVLSEEDIRQLCCDYENGTTFIEICDKYHIKEKRADKILAEHNIFRRTIHTGAGNTFLAKEDVQNILLDYENDFQPINYIINKYHISPKRLYSILKEHNIQLRKQKMYCGQTIVENFCLQLDKNSDFQGKTLNDLINPETNCKLHPDVWMPKYKTMVEYDGPQHYFPSFGKDALLKIQNTDKLKEEYCKRNNYNLIRIDGRIFSTDKEKIQNYIIEKLLEFGYDVHIDN